MLLEKARLIFGEQGFQQTKLEDVAKAAGFSKASIYNYFHDKEDLFLQSSIEISNELTLKLEDELKKCDSALDILGNQVELTLMSTKEDFGFSLALAQYPHDRSELFLEKEPFAGRNELMKKHCESLSNILQPLKKS